MTKTLSFTPERLKELLIEHDDGVLKKGAHRKGGRDFCAMEFIAKIAGEPWTDNPQCVHPALSTYCRSMNDALWPSDEIRTETMLPLLAAVFGTRDLKISMVNIVEQTIRLVVPMALRAAASMPGNASHADKLEAAAVKCEKEGSDAASYAAADAVRAASYAASDAASYAASYASYAASYAARAASDAARARAASYAAADAVSYAASDAARAASYAASDAACVEVYKVSISAIVAEIERARRDGQ